MFNPSIPLLEATQTELIGVVTKILKQQRFLRRQEVIECRKQRFFDRGEQYIWWDQKTYTFRPASDVAEKLPKYTRVYNIFSPHRRSIVSVLAQNPPGVTCQPNDLDFSGDVSAASLATKKRKAMEREVRLKERQAEIARLQCTDGRIVTWTRLDEVGKLKVTQHGVLETRVPIIARNMSEWLYCVLSADHEVEYLQEQYPQLADGIKADRGLTAEESYERYARLGVLGGTRSQGVDKVDEYLATEHQVWLRPAKYRKLNGEDEIRQIAPQGIHLTICGDTILAAEPAVMEDALSLAFAGPGDGMARPSILKDLVPLQIAFNDLMNMVQENLDHTIPATWFNPDMVDSAAIVEQESTPGAYHPGLGGNQMPMSAAFFQEAPSVLPQGLMEMIENLQTNLSQWITGDLPALFGAGTPDSDTFAGQDALRQQALGGFSIAWGEMQRMFTEMTRQGVELIMQRDGDQALGSYGWYPDSESSFPETAAAKKAALLQTVQILGQSPDGQNELMQPSNISYLLQVMGLQDDLKIRSAMAQDRQESQIEKLLREPPVPDTDSPDYPQYQSDMAQWSLHQDIATTAMQRGMRIARTPQMDSPKPQPPMKSSIAVEKYDYNQPMFDKLVEWLNSSARSDEEQRGNQPGIINVQLLADARQAVLQQNTPQAKPEPPSFSAKLEDQPVDVQVQLLAADGIQTTAEDIQNAQVQKVQSKVIEKTAGQSGGAA